MKIQRFVTVKEYTVLLCLGLLLTSFCAAGTPPLFHELTIPIEDVAVETDDKVIEDVEGSSYMIDDEDDFNTMNEDRLCDFESDVILLKARQGIDLATPKKASIFVFEISKNMQNSREIGLSAPLFNAVSSEKSVLGQWIQVQIPCGSDIFSLVSYYQNHPLIEQAQPNFRYKLCLEPNDPYYKSSGSFGQSYRDLYAMQLLNASGAWDRTTGCADIVVAMIDTGIDYTHEDIQENLWINPDEIPDGNDTDGDGFIDNLYGADFAYNDGDPLDGSGHGTHTSGTVAAVGNNGIGVVGVNWNCSIMAVKAFPDDGGANSSTLAACMRWAADNGADVLSNSWSARYPNYHDPLLEDAVNYSYYDKGCVVVFSAGNENDWINVYSPQNMKEVIAVSATAHNDVKWGSSNFGHTVVCAPGWFILSMRATGTSFGYDIEGNDRYAASIGTSFSCPHVSGLAALILSYAPMMPNTVVNRLIRSTCDDIRDENPGWIYRNRFLLGDGRINASRALQSIYDYDTRVERLEVSWEHIQIPQSLVVDTSILNNGRVDQSDVTVDLLVNDIVVDTQLLSTLDAYQSSDLVFSWTPTTAGVYDVKIMVSLSGGSDEMSENNVREVQVYVGVLNKDSLECFSTIQQALDDADTLGGHTLIVPEGSYPESLSVLKGVSLQARYDDTVVIDGAGAVSTLVQVEGVTGFELIGMILQNATVGLHLKSVIDAHVINNELRGFAEAGILLNESTEVLVSHNAIADNHIGIHGDLDVSSSVFRENDILANDIGMILDVSCDDNVIYHNTFDNTVNALLEGSNYCNLSYDAYLFWGNGNHWSDYTGSDADSDGIGDEGYTAGGCVDFYPLIDPWSYPVYVDDDNTGGFWEGSVDFPYQSIPQALENASDFDVILVRNGRYQYFSIDKSVVLLGENQELTILEDYGAIVTVNADRVRISRFTINGTKNPNLPGIFPVCVNIQGNDTVISNNILKNAYRGVLLSEVGGCRIEHNVFSDVGWLKYSLFGFYYSGVGVYVVLSSDVTIVNNSMNAKRNFSFDNVYAVYGGIIESIVVSQNRLHRFKRALSLAYVLRGVLSDNAITICESGVELIRVNDTMVLDNTLLLGGDFKGYGIVLDYCYNISVDGSLVQNGSIGIAVQRSDLVWVTRNLIQYITPRQGSGYSFGISCYLTSNVSVYHNDLIYNYQHAQDKWCDSNRWDDGYPSGGNFFDDYWGEDADGDGIGDTPYPIIGDESEDRYPLMDPIRDIQLPPQANFTFEIVSDRTIRFDALASRDRDGEVESYLWDFGDGTTDSGEVVEHTYTSDAYFSVNLTAIDDDGLEDRTQQTILVDITSPSITFIKPLNRRLYINEQLEFPFFKTVIIGKIHVHVDCVDSASGVDSVTLLIDGVSQGEQSSAPFVWLWDEKTPGRFRHVLKVETVDKVGNANTLEIPVIKFL